MSFDIFKPGVFSLVAVIMFIMAATSFGYLWKMKGRTRASQMMLWFFLCVMLSALATLFTNLGATWSWAFAPSQDALLILGGIFLVRFAYTYPEQDDDPEARWAARIASMVAIFALGYSLWFFVRYLVSLPVEIDESQLYYLLTPLVIFGVVLVFFRRSIKVSRLESPRGSSRSENALRLLLSPRTLAASGLRNLGLALAIGLIPAVVTLIKLSLPYLLASFLFNFGVVAAIAAIMLAYLNYSLEPTTITAKLVGISLVTILLMLGATCVSILTYFPALDSHRVVMTFILTVIISSVFILIVFPAFFKVTIFEPLANLLDGVRAADHGDLDQQVEVRFPDEVGFLTQAFNRMIATRRRLAAEQENRAAELEREVRRRTEEIQQVNQQLRIENIQRQNAALQLDQQLGFEQALAECSRILLSADETLVDRQAKLKAALDVLRQGADADRAYIIQRYEDAQAVERIRLSAEACAPGVKHQISNPANQRVRLSLFPPEVVRDLSSGSPVSGPTEVVFSGHEWEDLFRRQDPPLLSILLFPIHQENEWWGLVGFDDCVSPREWEQSEVTFLRTASEMIGSTLHRWAALDQLEETLQELEAKVEKRTASLHDANQKMRAEVAARRLVQENLERRLRTKRLLASASANLAEAKHISTAFEDVLQDLGELLRAGSTTLVIDHPGTPQSFRYTYNWHRPSSGPLDPRFINQFFERDAGLYSEFGSGDYRFLDPEGLNPSSDSPDAELPEEIILWPLVSDESVLGLLIICESELAADEKIDTLQAMEVFISLLGGMLERDKILRDLETRVTDQTRELSALYEMSILSGSSTDISEILYPALSRIQEISSSEAACIHLYSTEHDALILTTQRGIPAEARSVLERVSIGDHFKEWLHDPDPDHSTGGALSADVPEDFCLIGFGAIMQSKLRAADQTLGLISCYKSGGERYTAFQTSILAVIGELLGVVVENHRLSMETEKLATINERQRLARDLHDAVTQSLYSLSLFARSARDAYEEDDKAKLEDSLEHLELNSIAALREMRLLLYQLRSIALEEGDLYQAVDARLNMVERRLGIAATLDIQPDLILDESIEQELFHIVTEALNNSLHYADASEVTITLSEAGSTLRMTIEDDGRGFNPDEVQQGMGFQNMRERLQMFDGEVRIISHPGGGTHLEINMPLDQPKEYARER